LFEVIAVVIIGGSVFFVLFVIEFVVVVFMDEAGDSGIGGLRVGCFLLLLLLLLRVSWAGSSGGVAVVFKRSLFVGGSCLRRTGDLSSTIGGGGSVSSGLILCHLTFGLNKS
jgi:hypothetical protein